MKSCEEQEVISGETASLVRAISKSALKEECKLELSQDATAGGNTNMAIILMRHAPDYFIECLGAKHNYNVEAMAKEALNQSDPNGSKLIKVVEFVKSLSPKPKLGKVYNSGTQKAELTSQVIAHGIGYKGKILMNGGLEEIIPQDILKSQYEEKQPLDIIVSHMPPIEDFLRRINGEVAIVSHADAFYIEIAQNGKPQNFRRIN